MIRRQLSVFLVVGGLTVLVDFLVYRGALALRPDSVSVCKVIGFLAGTLFAYVANRWWTFGHTRHGHSSAWRFALLYAVTLGFNTGVNAGVLHVLSDFPWRITAAFLCATGVSCVLNFLGMKFFVFNSSAIESR